MPPNLPVPVRSSPEAVVASQTPPTVARTTSENATPSSAARPPGYPVGWPLHLPPFSTDLTQDDLPYDEEDDRPVASILHAVMIAALTRLLRAYFAQMGRRALVSSEMFVYYSPNELTQEDFRGPDVMVILDVEPDYPRRKSWVSWRENNRFPDLIVELLSQSTARVDRRDKKRIYAESFKTPNYFLYDPFDRTNFQGFELNAEGIYEPLVPDERGWLWCSVLGLWLGPWQGEVEGITAWWPRFFSVEGDCLLLPEEAAEARAQAARVLAESERQRAESERQRAAAAEELLQRYRDRFGDL